MIVVINKPGKSQKFLNLSHALCWRMVVSQEDRCPPGLKQTVRIEMRASDGTETEIKITSLKSKIRDNIRKAWGSAKERDLAECDLAPLRSAAQSLDELINQRAWQVAFFVEARLLAALQDQQPVCIVDWADFPRTEADLKDAFVAANKEAGEAIAALA